MKILHINNTDLTGARFNGYNLLTVLNREGISCKQAVYEKLSDNPNVVSFADSVPGILDIYKSMERKFGVHGVFYPYAHRIMRMKEFLKADIVHYHLIHNYILSLYDFPMLVRQKPSVWTLHDPWVFTGHCIHPINCQKYLDGCHSCDNLERHFPLQHDNSHRMWMLKKEIYSKIDIDIIVASKWMLNLVNSSPLTDKFNHVHLIPFGVNLERYKVDIERKRKIRKKMHINEKNFVLFFRADYSEFKGLKYIQKMLKALPDEYRKKILLLTVGEVDVFKDFLPIYRYIDNGWVQDEEVLADLYAASDVFLMPSVAEAFGLMAVEAMASSLPVIVMDGTALPSVVHSPDGGISIGQGDIEAFVAAIKRLMDDGNWRCQLGNEARRIAECEYDERIYYQRLLNVYTNIVERRKNEILLY